MPDPPSLSAVSYRQSNPWSMVYRPWSGRNAAYSLRKLRTGFTIAALID